METGLVYGQTAKCARSGIYLKAYRTNPTKRIQHLTSWIRAWVLAQITKLRGPGKDAAQFDPALYQS